VLGFSLCYDSIILSLYLFCSPLSTRLSETWASQILDFSPCRKGAQYPTHLSLGDDLGLTPKYYSYMFYLVGYDLDQPRTHVESPSADDVQPTQLTNHGNASTCTTSFECHRKRDQISFHLKPRQRRGEDDHKPRRNNHKPL